MNEKEIRIMFDYVKIGIIIFIFITCFFPFEKVFADSQTYEPINNGDCTTVEYRVSDNRPTKYSFFGSDLRGINIIRIDNGFNAYIISNSTFGISTSVDGNGACPVTAWSNAHTTVVNNITYYYWSTAGNGTTYRHNEWPSINIENNNALTTAIKYTFGDGAIGPEPVINYDLLQVSYYTDIAGSGDNSASNIDNIKWSLWDLSGNYIGDNKVQIRAVPGHFVAQDKTSLLQETFVNWVRESNLEVEVFKGSASDQHKFYTWQYIAGLFSSIKTWSGRFWSVFAKDDYWFQYGWIYEIRLLDENDEPLTQWQEIVTGTASKPSNTNTIENSDNLTPELVNTIEDINTENNVTVNWYINNITINMAPEETTDKPWWSYLLDAILELIRTIADLIGNLVDSLLGLFRFTTFEIPDWETKKTTIINNTGYFGQSILFVEDLKTTVQSASYVDPVLTYPGIELDGVELIPEVSVNLNDYVTSLGLTNFRSIAYTCTDGMIYLSLLILVIKKLEELLSK